VAVAIGVLGLNTNVDAGLLSLASFFVGVSLGITLGLQNQIVLLLLVVDLNLDNKQKR
jgi:hypothetical protein